MNASITVIGQKPAGFEPTRIGQAPGEGIKPTMSIQPTVIKSSPAPAPAEPAAPARAPAPTVIAPTRVAPTAIGSPVSGPRFAPTAIPASPAAPAPVVPPAPRAPIAPSILPGTHVALTQIALADLVSRFPGESEEVLQRARGLLAGISFASEGASFWLGFGVRPQEDLAGAIKERLALLDSPTVRSVSQHMARLQALLKDVVDAMEGGFLRKPAHKVWADCQAEVQQLEGLLRNGAGTIGTLIDKLGRLIASSTEIGVQLAVNARVLEFSMDKVPDALGSVVLGRLTAISSSQAMRLEHLAHTELQIQQLQELVSLVQNGILVKLPSLYSSLAALPAKPTETQRFLTVEKINELSQLLTR